jgi:outer membrane protein with beta-barrel domain
MSRNAVVVLLAAAVAVTPLAAGAQFTIKAGASFASTTESDLVPDVSNRTGFAAGIGYGFPLGSGAFSLQLEGLYVQKGGDLGDAGSLKIDELDFPILLQWKIPIAFLSPFLYAGPQAEFELSCTTADIDCVDTESLRWGGVLGLGVRFAQKFSGELRYNGTWSEISKGSDAKPRTILLLAGFSF